MRIRQRVTLGQALRAGAPGAPRVSCWRMASASAASRAKSTNVRACSQVSRRGRWSMTHRVPTFSLAGSASEKLA